MAAATDELVVTVAAVNARLACHVVPSVNHIVTSVIFHVARVGISVCDFIGKVVLEIWRVTIEVLIFCIVSSLNPVVAVTASNCNTITEDVISAVQLVISVAAVQI